MVDAHLWDVEVPFTGKGCDLPKVTWHVAKAELGWENHDLTAPKHGTSQDIGAESIPGQSGEEDNTIKNSSRMVSISPPPPHHRVKRSYPSSWFSGRFVHSPLW